MDIENDIIHIEETRDEDSTKTGERRDILLAPELKEEFQKSPKNGEYVFDAGDFEKSWASSLRRAGITDFRSTI